MAKVGVGVCMEDVYYPECPYATMDGVYINSCFCTLKKSEYRDGFSWCNIVCYEGSCPFDLHKELYGEDAE